MSEVEASRLHSGQGANLMHNDQMIYYQYSREAEGKTGDLHVYDTMRINQQCIAAATGRYRFQNSLYRHRQSGRHDHESSAPTSASTTHGGLISAVLLVYVT